MGLPEIKKKIKIVGTSGTDHSAPEGFARREGGKVRSDGNQRNQTGT
jgi:hypothetical protein